MSNGQTHERLSALEYNAKLPSERSFGITFAVVFTVIALIPVVHGGAIRFWSLGVGAAFLAVRFIAPDLLRPLNKLWFNFGQLLHKIVSPVILGAMYFLAFTPMALIIRLLGKKLLNLRYDSEAISYWIERNPPGPSSDSVRRQF